jgi:putative aldouronate transport system substrate-binding protein
MKKFLALLLALCMTVGVMAGCGSTSSSSTSASSGNSTAAADTAEAAGSDEESTGSATGLAAEVFGEDASPEAVSYPIDTDETLELMATFPDTLFSSYPNGLADCQIYQVAEEQTGVKMTYNSLSTNSSSEQFNVIIASGSYPDLIGWGLDIANGDDAAVEDDIYLDLSEYVAKYAPNYYNLLSSDEELLQTALTDSGYLTSFYTLRTEQALEKAGLVIRTDLLEKLGLDKPYTVDEFETVLAAFKDEGLEQPLVMLAPGAIQDNWLSGAFDVPAFCNNFPLSVVPTYVVDGEVKFGPLEDGFKDYLTLIHDWFEKGYISADFVSKNSNWNGPDYSNAITNGEAGIFYADQGNISGYIAASEVEGFDLEATYDMHADSDSVNHFAEYQNKAASNGFHITSNCSNIELACQWGDWWYSDEASLLANYGVEGVSFEYVDGVPKFTETVTEAPEGQRDALLIYASNGTISCVIDNNAISSGYDQVDVDAPAIWDTGMDDAYVIPDTVVLSADEETEANGIYSDIETTCMEYIAKFINGDKSLDEYDSFVETLESMNIQGYLDIYQEAYDRAMSK